MTRRSYYDILQVSRRATAKEIKENYYKLSKIHHPDLNGDQAKFLELGEAYQCLMDAGKRREYDQSLGVSRDVGGTSSSAQGGSYGQYGSNFRKSRPRPTINPDDYILHRRSRPSKLYNYDAHFSEHYPQEQKRGDRLGKSLYYRNVYANHSVQGKLYMWSTVMGLTIFLFASGWVEMIGK